MEPEAETRTASECGAVFTLRREVDISRSSETNRRLPVLRPWALKVCLGGPGKGEKAGK